MGFGSWAKNNAGSIIGAGATIYGAVKGNQAENRANAMSDRQMQQVEKEYAERAGLRSQGMAGVLQQRNPLNMDGVGFDTQNPFARDRGQRSLQRSAPPQGAAAPMAGQPMAPPSMPGYEGTQEIYGQGRNLPETDPATLGLRYNPQTGRYESTTPYTGPTIYGGRR